MTARLSNSGLNLLLRSPAGPVARFIDSLGQQVLAEAKQAVGYDTLHDFSRYPAHLRDTLVVQPILRGGERGVRVGSEQPYALEHHEGIPPHVVRPRPGGRLVFRSRRTGELVTLKVDQTTQHPGAAGNPYLRQPLENLRGRI